MAVLDSSLKNKAFNTDLIAWNKSNCLQIHTDGTVINVD
jgi:hypothetical protein